MFKKLRIIISERAEGEGRPSWKLKIEDPNPKI